MAQLLGVRRQTIGHRLALYEARGLDARLALSVPAGKPLSLPPEVLAASAPARRRPAGFAAYEALRHGVQQTYHLGVHSHPLYPSVRTTCQTTRKGARPRHTNKP